MKLKIPPVIVFLVFGLLMYLLARLLPFGHFDFTGRFYLMTLLLLFAALIALVALIQFFKSRTTIDPTQPTKSTKLVDKGIYAYSRNPMYLALLLVLLAWGIWLGNAFNMLLAAGFVAYMNRFQVLPEEEALNDIFGKEYRQYFMKVRRWF